MLPKIGPRHTRVVAVAACASAPTASADQPTGHTSFRSFKQVDAGVLNIGDAEDGPVEHNVPQEAPRQFADAIIEVAGY